MTMIMSAVIVSVMIVSVMIVMMISVMILRMTVGVRSGLIPVPNHPDTKDTCNHARDETDQRPNHRGDRTKAVDRIESAPVSGA